MQILVDADACPVVGIVEKLARERKIPVILLCDTNHVLNSEYSEVRVIGAGADAVDFALVSLCTVSYTHLLYGDCSGGSFSAYGCCGEEKRTGYGK